ncbi:MAG: tRNA pseudouridine(55) synthase TruB [Clostridiaceae bacterium]|nr:tRNA pseudouridine(55) synthase TruB [Clostridiaceae bacterium]
MDGILLVIKPPDMTSFDVVAWLRSLTGVKKIGHGGTLDPSACGLIPVCFGKATKTIEYFQNFDKVYRAEMILGISTNTQDGDGEIVEESDIRPDIDAINAVFRDFTGEYEQIPPMFSAVKIKGKKLYELARKGIEIERKERKVNIKSLKLLHAELDLKNPVLRFEVRCSKGTYIRTLCHDIGKTLGCGAYMSFLVRTQAGPFSVCEGLTPEEIKGLCAENALNSALKPMDVLFTDYSSVIVDDSQIKKYVNGMPVMIKGNKSSHGKSRVRVYSEKGLFLGIGLVFPDDGNIMIRSEKLLVKNPQALTGQVKK